MPSRRRRPSRAARAAGSSVPGGRAAGLGIDDGSDRESSRRIGDVIGGYRVIRKLGAGERGVVYLGHAGGDPARTAAIKVYRPAVPTADIEREVEALTRAAHPHTVALRDLASVASGQPCLVLERLGRGSLAGLLASGRALRPGEAVTVLAPLATALDAMHGSGVVHGRLRAASVLFRHSGAPVLACFGSATVAADLPSTGLRTAAQVADDDAVREDRASFAALAGITLAPIPEAAGVVAWLERERAGGFADPFGAELAERLFSTATPEAVRFGDTVAPVPVPARTTTGARPEPEAQPDPGSAASPVLPGWVAALHLPEWIDDLVRSLATRPGLVALAGRLAVVRRRYWLGAGAVAVSLVAAVLVVPSDGAAEPVPVPSALATTGSPTPAEPGAVGDDDTLGDDPIAALATLLEARNRCVRDLSIVCLDAALQQDSAAMERDVALIRSLQQGGEAPATALIGAPAITLVERLGDTALLDLGAAGVEPVAGEPAAADSNPASALVSRGEAGWRIRGYLD